MVSCSGPWGIRAGSEETMDRCCHDSSAIVLYDVIVENGVYANSPYLHLNTDAYSRLPRRGFLGVTNSKCKWALEKKAENQLFGTLFSLRACPVCVFSFLQYLFAAILSRELGAAQNEQNVLLCESFFYEEICCAKKRCGH